MRFNRSTIPNAIAAIRRIIRRLRAGQRITASDEVVDMRRAICWACPSRDVNQCVECTCFIDLKTRLASEKCPLGHWREETILKSGI